MSPVQPFNWFGAQGALTNNLLGRYARWFHGQVNGRWPAAKEQPLQPFKPPLRDTACLSSHFNGFVGYAIPALRPYKKRTLINDAGTYFEERFRLEPEAGEFKEVYKPPKQSGIRWVRDLRDLDVWIMARIAEKDKAPEVFSYGVAV